MKLLKIVIVLLSVLLLNSCGDKVSKGPKEKTLTIKSAKITGDVNKYLKIVDGDYTIKKIDDYAKLIIPVKFEVIKTLNKPAPDIYEKDFIAYNADNAPISDMGSNFSLESSSDRETLNSLLNGKVGDTEIVNYEWSYFGDEKRQIRILNEIVSYKIKLNGILYGKGKYDALTENSVSPDTKPSSDSKDWDVMLDNYDEYVDEYIKFYKKAMQGDASAITEYTSILAKAEKFQNSLASAQNDNSLSTTQINRMMKIQTKMINAIKQ